MLRAVTWQSSVILPFTFIGCAWWFSRKLEDLQDDALFIDDPGLEINRAVGHPDRLAGVHREEQDQAIPRRLTTLQSKCAIRLSHGQIRIQAMSLDAEGGVRCQPWNRREWFMSNMTGRPTGGDSQERDGQGNRELLHQVDAVSSLSETGLTG